jgi:hypothetical protein
MLNGNTVNGDVKLQICLLLQHTRVQTFWGIGWHTTEANLGKAYDAIRKIGEDFEEAAEHSSCGFRTSAPSMQILAAVDRPTRQG